MNGDRLATLQKRDAALQTKIEAEKERLRKQEVKEKERLFRIVGEACCKAAQHPEFGPLLKTVLEAGTDQRARAFLRQRGIL